MLRLRWSSLGRKYYGASTLSSRSPSPCCCCFGRGGQRCCGHVKYSLCLARVTACRQCRGRGTPRAGRSCDRGFNKQRLEGAKWWRQALHGSSQTVSITCTIDVCRQRPNSLHHCSTTTASSVHALHHPCSSCCAAALREQLGVTSHCSRHPPTC